MKSTRLKALAFFSLLLAAFAAGAAFHKYKTPLRNALRNQLSRSHVNPGAVINSQYTRDYGEVDLKKDLDTALLPLRLNGIRVSEHYDFPKTAGGITVIGDTVVIVDRLGNVYVYGEGKLEKRLFPALPNNISAFVSESASPLDPGTLRVHDVEYVEFANALAVSHERYDQKLKRTRLAVSMIVIDPKTIEPVGSWEIIFLGDVLNTSTYAGLGGGGRLAAKSPDKLVLTNGDYNQDGVMLDTPKVAQMEALSFGKVIEINIRTKEHRTLSRGHRNPQGLLIAQDGEIFSTEHGPAGGDELNHIKEGADYGWPSVSLGVDYGAYNWPNTKFAGEHREYTLPMFAWVPSIGVSNLIQVRGMNRRWDGDFLVASLKAATLFRLRLDGDRVLYSEPIWIGERIRDIAQLKNGTIVLWTDDAKLLFLRVDQAKLEANKRDLDITAPPIMAMCMGCHHFGPTNPSHPGPTLSDLVGKKIASDSFSRYSTALKNRPELWTPDTLRAFIADPNRFANGTLMPKPDLNEEDVARIVSVLVAAPK